ncbi:MAG: AMP-binding protein, partial [Campylobacterota bacterium]
MTYPYENLENFTLPSLFNRSIGLYADQNALGKAGETPMKYSQMNEKVQEVVELLRKNGITKGDKVLLLSENMPNWGVAYFAITYFGAIVVPVLPDFHPSDVHHIIRHSEAKAVFVSDRHLTTIEECADHDLNFVIKLDDLVMVDELTNKSYISKLADKITKSSEMTH